MEVLSFSSRDCGHTTRGGVTTTSFISADAHLIYCRSVGCAADANAQRDYEDGEPIPSHDCCLSEVILVV
jgi:hypothetical protein